MTINPRIMAVLATLSFVTAALVGCRALLDPFVGLYHNLPVLLNPATGLIPPLDSSPWSVVTAGFSLDLANARDKPRVRSRGVHDGRVVEADDAGNVTMIDLETGDVLATRDMQAVAVIWSNDGERIAIVTRDTAYHLLIADDQLEETARFEIDLPLPDPSSDYRTFALSWQADDSHIAISTDAIPEGPAPPENVINDSVSARCTVLAMADGSRLDYELTNVFFLQDDWVVGSIPGSEVVDTATSHERVHVMRLVEGRIEDRLYMIGSRFAVASYPPGGVFASVEELSSGFARDGPWTLHVRSREARSPGSLMNWSPFGAVSIFPQP